MNEWLKVSRVESSRSPPLFSCYLNLSPYYLDHNTNSTTYNSQNLDYVFQSNNEHLAACLIKFHQTELSEHEQLLWFNANWMCNIEYSKYREYIIV